MQNTRSEPSSLVATRDTADPGDSTGQNFRYQYAYGVILLAASVRRELDYHALWCEQHEDFLGEIGQNLFDAYQVKTQQPENGWWQHNSEAYTKSVRRFVNHEKSFPGKIRQYFFVSNTRPLNTEDKKLKYQSPIQLIKAVLLANDLTELGSDDRRTFDYLLEQAELLRDDGAYLFGVLRRLEFPEAPDRGAFITTLSHEHVSKLEECENLNASQLDAVTQCLINLVASASSLGSQDPSRHYVALVRNGSTDPQLLHKRIDLTKFRTACQEAAQPSFSYPVELSTDPLKTDIKRLERFRRKLQEGGFSTDEMEALRRQTILAHGKLLEMATRGGSGEALVREIENLILDECTTAKIAASSGPPPYGKQMYLSLRKRLQEVAKEEAPRVKRLPFEVLMGMAGLLTEDCSVWWSEKFDLAPKP